MTHKKLTQAQERAKAKLRTDWMSAVDLRENPFTLDVLAKYGLAEIKLPTLVGGRTILFRLPE